MKANNLHIIGGGVLGQHIAHYALLSNIYTSVYFIDDIALPGTKNEYGAIIGKTNEIAGLIDSGEIENLVVGVGYKHMDYRNHIFLEYKSKVNFPNIIHASCYIDKNVFLGCGNIILPGCVIDTGTILGDNIFMNPGCIIAHDNCIKNNTFMGPGVKTSGFVTIGSSCFLGTGTITVDNVSICDNVSTGAGAVITKNLTISGTYIGTPARLNVKADN